MNELVKAVSKDLYINSHHYDNPFAEDKSHFYVRLLEIRSGWIAYSTWNKHVKYSKYEDFFQRFERPMTIPGKVCADFALCTIKEYKEARRVGVIDNPWKFGKKCENYKATEFTFNLEY